MATKLKEIDVKSFRALKEVKIEISDHITVICGKNGTAKSSILGLAAQIFSFDTDYIKKNKLDYRTVTGEHFKSHPLDHFRFSTKFDVSGSMDVNVLLHDGYTNSDATGELRLYTRTIKNGTDTEPRPVVRNNSIAKSINANNTSRNFTHPVIFLSLQRLTPIATRVYKPSTYDYLKRNEKTFLNISNTILNKLHRVSTATTGTIKSAVAHGDEYDQESVSAGEDNVGQIVLALMSFKKLQEEYPDYQGGLLLIDEADAGLFPGAQLQLIKVLEEYGQRYKVQTIMTTHSPTIIQEIYEKSKKFPDKYKTAYLSNSYGKVEVKNNVSWGELYADLHITTISTPDGNKLPRINIYFEDNEAYEFHRKLLGRNKFLRYTNALNEISLSCGIYISLIKNKVPEFCVKSVVVLDPDIFDNAKEKALTHRTDFPTMCVLPGNMPPDQILFEYLYNKPADHNIWRNDAQFSKEVFIRCAQPVIQRLSISESSLNLKSIIFEKRKIAATPEEKKPRELFKKFYNTREVTSFLKLPSAQNPWSLWRKEHKQEAQDYATNFEACIKFALRKGFGVDQTLIDGVAK